MPQRVLLIRVFDDVDVVGRVDCDDRVALARYGGCDLAVEEPGCGHEDYEGVVARVDVFAVAVRARDVEGGFLEGAVRCCEAVAGEEDVFNSGGCRGLVWFWFRG